MIRTISFLSISFCLLFFVTVFAAAHDNPRPYEEIYPEIGYKTVDEALNDFEQHFNQSLKLPLRVPPLIFTHYFGRFNNSEGDINDSFEVIFINDQSSENHYNISVRPIKYKVPVQEKYVLETFTLKNGNEAIYLTFSGFNILVFERDNWQYMLQIDKRVSNKVTSETLLDIANSMD
ncbi:hypothetical protein [Sporosarcina ureilytica]|uniref:DUF4367 domain-containing protein n=1 Tax=Sporosarcina ureilytica TaxID=298596 RepID=A0A1D8JED0_9BACL|nr:hypothetical protein [Sporosarcina ureilytica]AOV07072.1 hypothetical protein BI350_05600 [Sporosarcina ureilytica]